MQAESDEVDRGRGRRLAESLLHTDLAECVCHAAQNQYSPCMKKKFSGLYSSQAYLERCSQR